MRHTTKRQPRVHRGTRKGHGRPFAHSNGVCDICSQRMAPGTSSSSSVEVQQHHIRRRRRWNGSDVITFNKDRRGTHRFQVSRRAKTVRFAKKRDDHCQANQFEVPLANEDTDLNGNRRLETNFVAETELVSEEECDTDFPPRRNSATEVPSSIESSLIAAFLGSPIILLSPFFCWGTAMVAMKTVVTKTSPFFVAAHRLIPAGIVLLIFCGLSDMNSTNLEKGQEIDSSHEDIDGITNYESNSLSMIYKKVFPQSPMAWIAIIIFATVDAAMFQGFLATGLATTTAGLGSVIIDSQPITVAILAYIFLNEEITAKKALGLFIGVFGLVLLEVDLQSSWQWYSDVLSQHDSSAILIKGSLTEFLQESVSKFDLNLSHNGEFAMLLAAQSMACGTLIIRWVNKWVDPVVSTGWHLLLGGIPLALLSIYLEDGLHLYAKLNADDFLSLAYTSMFGCAVGYGIFFYLASSVNLTKLSSLTFTTPIFASLFGYLLLGETLSQTQITGAMVTLVGVGLIV